MSNAQPIVVRAAKKPISTLAHPLPSVNLSTQAGATGVLRAERRLAVAAASCIVENVVAFEIAAAVVDQFGGNSLAEIQARWKLFHEMAAKNWKMIQLHDKTRRRICLAAFVSLCLVPTAVVAAWCVAWQLPGHKAAEIARLRQQTGMDVDLTGLDHPRPGTLRYRGLTLSDPETGQAVLRCRPAGSRLDPLPPTRQARRRPSSRSRPPEAEIDAAGANRLGQLLDRILQNQGDCSDVEFHLSAGQLTLDCDEGPQTLTDVEGAIEAIRGGARPAPPFARPRIVLGRRGQSRRRFACGAEIGTVPGRCRRPCGFASRAIAA